MRIEETALLNDGSTPPHCSHCATKLVGEYCHGCGRAAHVARPSLRNLFTDVRHRVFRLDPAYPRTLWRMLSAPGELARDFFASRTKGILDPIQYFITCTFIEMIVFGIAHKLALALDRVSALNWLTRIGSIVAIKIVVVLWLGSVWYVLFRAVRYNLAEIYAFTIYAFGTIGVLLLALPVIDLLTPTPLAGNPQLAMLAMLGVEVVYLSYAVQRFAQNSLWSAIWRVCVALATAYALPAWIFGAKSLIRLAAPALSE